MYKHQDRWYSSFLSMNEHIEGISAALQVLTVRSASSGDGRHVSMYLEKPEGPGFSTQIIELTAAEGNPEPAIKIAALQLVNKHGQLVRTDLHSSTKGPAELLRTHRTCYKIDSTQSTKFLEAARRFEAKAKHGRYTYHHEGGIKARLATRPGTRGVNCADFVIKVLKEAGIAQLGYKYKSTPYRVAHPG